MAIKKIFLNKRNKGFSLSELLIVLTIAGLLIIWLLTNLNPQALIGKGKDSRRKADLKKIQIALEDYYSDHDCYPTSLPDCGSPFLPGQVPYYLNPLPCDPDGKDYYYVPGPGNCPRSYQIYVNLNNLNDPEIEKIGCSEGCGPAGVAAFNYGVSSSNVALEPYAGSLPTGTTAPALPSPTSVPTFAPTATIVPPSPTIVPTTPPSGQYYGCVNFVCQPIPGPICSPNYEDINCLGIDCSNDAFKCREP